MNLKIYYVFPTIVKISTGLSMICDAARAKKGTKASLKEGLSLCSIIGMSPDKMKELPDKYVFYVMYILCFVC